MQAEIAKRNPVLMKQAMRFYLHHARQYRSNGSNPPPCFCFMSLWNDEEPYPLAELMTVLQDHIAELVAVPYMDHNESHQVQIKNLNSNLRTLAEFAKRLSKEQKK